MGKACNHSLGVRQRQQVLNRTFIDSKGPSEAQNLKTCSFSQSVGQ